MKDGLLCGLAGGAYEIHSVGRQSLSDREAYSNDAVHQASPHCSIKSQEVRDVRSRNHKRVSKGCGGRWQERHPVSGRADDLSRLVFTSGYATEVAVGACAVKHRRYASGGTAD
jgi:hypothetical protein